MVEIESWMKGYSERLHEAFGERVWFIGLQGSYARGEAAETSDIDAVCILDFVTVQDVEAYGEILDHLPHRSLICGFFGGKDDLLNWDPSELFQFYHDTIPYSGSLEAVLGRIDAAAIDRAVLQAACGVYHGCVHNMKRGDPCGPLQIGDVRGAGFRLQGNGPLREAPERAHGECDGAGS